MTLSPFFWVYSGYKNAHILKVRHMHFLKSFPFFTLSPPLTSPFYPLLFSYSEGWERPSPPPHTHTEFHWSIFTHWPSMTQTNFLFLNCTVKVRLNLVCSSMGLILRWSGNDRVIFLLSVFEDKKTRQRKSDKHTNRHKNLGAKRRNTTLLA